MARVTNIYRLRKMFKQEKAGVIILAKSASYYRNRHARYSIHSDVRLKYVYMHTC